MAPLDGKTAVIAGGTTGIGLATARRFVDDGATVYAAIKAAVRSFARTWASELRERGIRDLSSFTTGAEIPVDGGVNQI
jgi:NAD(P)-dependent dehydrogenase (short-subunit alcohol dehydrogenase family)